MAARINNCMFYVKTSALVIIVLMGFVQIVKQHGEIDSFNSAFTGTTTSVGEIGLAMYSGLFAYAGL